MRLETYKNNTAACRAALNENKDPPIKVDMTFHVLLLLYIKVLAELGADLEAHCEDGETPLILAINWRVKRNIKFVSKSFILGLLYQEIF